MLAHAQALLHGTAQGRTVYLQADLTDPDSVPAAPQLGATLDLGRPVALSLNAVLHFVIDDTRAIGIVEAYKAALAPGSALVVSHATADFTPQPDGRLTKIYKSAGTSVTARTRDRFEAFFAGWTLVQPGVTTPPRWRPAPEDGEPLADREANGYAAVAWKPGAARA